MRHHITDITEIREVGILVQTIADEEHKVRVLGALKEVPTPNRHPSKDQMSPRADPSAYDQYHSGELSGEQEDPEVRHFHPRVPSFFVTRNGEAVFLKRDRD